MEALKKMSAKSILGNVKRFVPLNADKDVIDGEKVALFRVFGVARGIKKGASDNGDWLAFLGDFRAERVNKDGEVEQFMSTTLFLPACAEMVLSPVVLENDGSGIEFAFDIGLVGRPNSSVGYEFTADSVLPVKENDAIAPLKALLPPPKWARTAALNAPEAAGKVESSAEKAKGKNKVAEATA